MYIKWQGPRLSMSFNLCLRRIKAKHSCLWNQMDNAYFTLTRTISPKTNLSTEKLYLPLAYKCHWAYNEIATTNKWGFLFHKVLKTSKLRCFFWRYWRFIWTKACFTVVIGRLTGRCRSTSFGMREKERNSHYSLPKSHRICQNLQLYSLFIYFYSNTKEYRHRNNMIK